MRIRLDHHSGEAIYRQIIEQIKFQIASGKLEDGFKLPSIRALANELKINPRTVVKAYDELKESGLATMRQGQGVFVSAKGDHLAKATRKKNIAELAQRLFAEGFQMGASPQEIIEIIKETAETMESDKNE